MRFVKLKRLIAHNYLRPFRKLFPYMDLRSEITGHDGDMACKMVYDLIKSDAGLEERAITHMLASNKTLEKQITKKCIEKDRAYCKELIDDQFEKHRDLKEKVFFQVAAGDKEMARKATFDYLKGNKADRQKVVRTELNEDDAYYKELVQTKLKRDDTYYKELVRAKLEKDKEIRKELDTEFAAGERIVYGRVEKAIYSAGNQCLYVSGFYLPLSAYDKVTLYCDDVCIGNAETGVIRREFTKKYPVFNAMNAGWQLYVKPLQIENLKKVEAVLYKDGQEVYRSSREVQIEEDAFLLDDKPYWINMNSMELRNSDVHKRIERFNSICHSLQDWMPWDDFRFYEKYISMKQEIAYSSKRVEEIFIEIFSIDNVMQFKNAEIEYQSANKFWLIVNELLINQEYYFETDNEAPFIIDGGSNIGLATFYFLTLYPKAEILAFEPSKDAYEVLQRNVERNHWEKVRILPYALDLEEKECELLVPKNDCLGASLTERATEYADDNTVITEKIMTKKLSTYITKPVEFLKLDIEGVEVRVLRELSEKLSEVSCLFCEYHYGENVTDNDFMELVAMLEQYGFAYHVTKSPSYQRMTGTKTMSYVGKRVSLNVWAKKRYD